MATAQNWYIFGAAAICRALGRPLPLLTDVHFAGARPDRQDIVNLLDVIEPPQIRYTDTPLIPLVDLDYIQIRRAGMGIDIRDPTSVLLSKRVVILDHDIGVVDAIRIRHMMALFSDFEWPEHLRRKVDSDHEYAKIACRHDDGLRLAMMNLDHDFGVVGNQPGAEAGATQ